MDNTRSPLLNRLQQPYQEYIDQRTFPNKDAVNYGSKEKQTIRGCDYRDAAVVLPRMMRDQQAQLQVPSGMIELLETLSEIGRILYSRESQRTSQSVTWKHWILLKEVLLRDENCGGTTPMHFWHMLLQGNFYPATEH